MDEVNGGGGQQQQGGDVFNQKGGFGGTFGEDETERGFGARPPQQRGGFGPDRGGAGGFGGPRGGRRGFRGGGRGGFDRDFEGGGGGGFRGGRGGFGGRGRQFDRHSGSAQTGVKAQDKREGGGAYNWGNNEDELAGETENLNTTSSDEAPQDAEQNPEGGQEEAKEVVEEARELTLDEWKAMQAPKAKPQFNIRQANDGEQQKLKDYKKLQKETYAEDHEDEEESEDEEDRQGRKKKMVDIQVTFLTEGKGQVRGRGRGMGGRGRGGPRGRGPGPAGERGGYGPRGGGFGPGRGGGSGREYKMDEDSFPELPSAVVA